MKLLKTFGEKMNNVHYEERHAVRAVVLDDIGRVALLYVGKTFHHGLPGGGMKQGESKLQALKREVREETGVNAKVLEEVGITNEYRDFLDPARFEINYAYIVHENGLRKAPQLTTKELGCDFELKWVEINKAIELFENDEKRDRKSEFIVGRDLAILKKAKEIIEE
jgi:8-oxo-dGTP diphosphatase